MTENSFEYQCLKTFDRIEKQRKEIFSKLDALTHEQLHYSPRAEKWNLLQIVLHLMTSEKLSVIYIKRRADSKEEVTKSGLMSKFRSFALKVGLTLPIKFTAPKMTDATGKEPDYKELKSDWQKVRSELDSLIKKLEVSTLKSEIFKHPVVGEMNMKQALEFMETHTAHHRKQIQQIMNDSSFPKRG